MITCIILAAGLSQRFGSPKGLAEIQGEPVISRLQKLLLTTSISEIIIVLGAHAEQIKPYILNHTKIKFVYNKDFNLGQTSSFKVGLQAVDPQAQAIMLLPVDYPLIKKETIETLAQFYLKKHPLILIPAFEGRKGHPPIFHQKYKKDFLALDDSAGINAVAHKHMKEVVLADVNDEGILKSFNTPEELEKIQKSL